MAKKVETAGRKSGENFSCMCVFFSLLFLRFQRAVKEQDTNFRGNGNSSHVYIFYTYADAEGGRKKFCFIPSARGRTVFFFWIFFLLRCRKASRQLCLCELHFSIRAIIDSTRAICRQGFDLECRQPGQEPSFCSFLSSINGCTSMY